MLAKGLDQMRAEKNTIFPNYNVLPTRDFKLFFPCVSLGNFFFSVCMFTGKFIGLLGKGKELVLNRGNKYFQF